MENSYELNREVRALKNDKLMTERAIEHERSEWARKLNGNVGKDIKNVLSGKVKVKFTLKERIKFKLNKFKKIFSKNNGDYIEQQ